MSNKRIDVMIDLETMGLGTNAPILSIGAVAFSQFGVGIESTFHQGISLEDSMASGRRPTASTILWWLQQSDEAREQVCQKGGCGVRLAAGLAAFDAWIKSLPGVPYVWGNGANFDIAILEQAYLDAGMRTPWGYRNVRCFRTVMAEFGVESDWVKPVVAHDALADAEAQARTLQKCYQRMAIGSYRLPKTRVRCETADGHGACYIDPLRVEQEDDGSVTVVVNAWPDKNPGDAEMDSWWPSA